MVNEIEIKQTDNKTDYISAWPQIRALPDSGLIATKGNKKGSCKREIKGITSIKMAKQFEIRLLMFVAAGNRMLITLERM